MSVMDIHARGLPKMNKSDEVGHENFLMTAKGTKAATQKLVKAKMASQSVAKIQ